MVWENAMTVYMAVCLQMSGPLDLLPDLASLLCSQAVCYGYLKVLQVLGDEGSVVGYR